MRKAILASAIAALTVLTVLPAVASTNRATLDIVGQGPGGTTVGEAVLTRGANGIHVLAKMSTPEPGSYDYPMGAVVGSPEVYSLWAFVFADPDLCDGACGGLDDVEASGGGVFALGGHAVGGSTLNLSGHVSKNTEPFTLPERDFSRLSRMDDAEVHIAIAPHGALDPAQLPGQFVTPIGTPANWWIAIFD